MEVTIILIYKCDFPNGKTYIGQTVRPLSERIAEHVRDSYNINNKGYYNVFHKAIRKYGVENIVWNVVETVDSIDELNDREKYWISYYNSYVRSERSNGYNMTIGGSGVVGVLHSEESREKNRIASIGNDHARRKLNTEDVLQIVELSKTMKQVELSRIYGVSEAQISRILSGKKWSHITNIGLESKNNKDA